MIPLFIHQVFFAHLSQTKPEYSVEEDKQGLCPHEAAWPGLRVCLCTLSWGPVHTQLRLSIARACDSSQRAFSLTGIAYFL